MSLKRSDFVLRAREAADAANATRDWPPDHVLLLAETVLDDEWSEILDIAPYYRTATRSVTLGAGNAAALTALDNGTTPVSQRTYRVLQMWDGATAGAREIPYAEPWEVRLNRAPTSADPLWWTIDGDNVLVSGVAAGAVLTVKVNHKPALVSLLTDNDVVEYVPGQDLIPIYATAATMLAKGAREAQEAEYLASVAESRRSRMLDNLARRFGGPRRVAGHEEADTWGGQ